jgi:hypothetical protein
MCVLPCDDECEVISIKAEQDTDIEIKEEEIPEPEINAEPDEVSYVSVCHRYIKMARLFSGLLSWSLHLINPSMGMEISVSCWFT